ncbi:hypothetical protein SNE40_022000 [Patella caerulea]|uniref:Hexosyltransferase n=1 Tax=Patella caerulea TaxID=87958 RepID=A0AAN8IYI0_PATCE
MYAVLCSLFQLRGKKKNKCIAAAFVVLMMWIIYYVVYEYTVCGSDPYSFLSEHCFADTRTHSYKYLINEAEICKPLPDNIFLLIVVPSRTSEFEERQVIRQTWGSLAVNNTEIRLVFMLGYRPEIDQQVLKSESETYHDIIQEDFYDSYRNLSIKSEAILRFANTFCSNVKYILKVDADVFVNLPALIEDLRERGGTNMIMGYVFSFRMPFRDQGSKFYFERISYPLTYLPTYLNGPAYVLSGDTPRKLLSVALNTKQYALEDIFITGVVRKRAAVQLIHHRRFDYRKPFVDICWFEHKIIGHSFNKEQMLEIWSQKVQNKTCTTSIRVFYMLHDRLALW